jgi:hypothetical protein
MFEAIRREDRASLRTLAKTFTGMGNQPAALLCLDHVFFLPLKLQNRSLVEVRASLSLYLDYVRLLNNFRRNQSLAEGSNHQKLFGFQVLGDRYLVPEHTLLYEKLTNQSGSGKKSVDGHKCSHDELGRVINQLISSRINDRTKIQNGTCRDVQGFSPCLHLLIQKECSALKGKGSCNFLHVRQEQLTLDWYHARLRLILLQFQILNLARYDNSDVKKCVLVHSVETRVDTHQA